MKSGYLTTSIEVLDHLLGGKGFETGKVYEIYGPEGTGKSNLLHQLVCTAFMSKDEGGLGAGTIYIDTGGTFSIRRIHRFAIRLGIDPNEITRSVLRAAPPTSDDLLSICENQLGEKAVEFGARLFCLDSLAILFGAEYDVFRQQYPIWRPKAERIIEALRRTCQLVNRVGLVTNSVWQRNIKLPDRLRMEVKPYRDGLRLIAIEDNEGNPTDYCFAYITDNGFIDLEPAEHKTLRSTLAPMKFLIGEDQIEEIYLAKDEIPAVGRNFRD